MATVHPKIADLANKVIAEGKNKRAIAALKVLLKKGEVTTDDLNDLGYNHPPRAIGDVRDAGIPIKTGSATSSKSGKRMAVYTFGDPADIQSGRIGGRSAFPKAFKTALLQRYGSKDCITGAVLDERVLQIDHRIPYRVAGDAGLSDHDVEHFMLLDASSQRQKSWSCENCPNMKGKRDLSICKSCYWASPEDYKHIATAQIRRADVVWQGKDVEAYALLAKEASKRGMTVSDLIRVKLR